MLIRPCARVVLRRFLTARRPIPRFGAVTQLSDRRQQPLQRPATHRRKAHEPRIAGPGELHLEPLPGHGFERRLPAVLRRRPVIAASGRFAPARMDPVTTMSGTTSRQATPISCRSNCGNRIFGPALNGWQVSGSVFRHSGIPFSILSTSYSANGNGIVNLGDANVAQFASVVPGASAYQRECRRWCHPARNKAMAESRMPLYRVWIRAPARAWEAIRRGIVNLAIWGAILCAAPTSPGAIST